MCSRYYRFKDLKDLIVRFKIAQVLSVLGPQYNIALTDPALVIPATEDERVAKEIKFSFPNPWVPGKPLFNMRGESFVSKPAFKNYLLNQRCLVIADGFLEPREPDDKKAKKDYFRIDLKDHETYGLAGIYTPDGFAIITTEPNALVATIHDRMPVILRRDDEDLWLDSRVKEFSKLITLLAPFPADALEMTQVSRLVNNSKNKMPEVLQPVSAR